MQEVRVTFAAPQDRRLHADTTAIQAEGAIGGEVCLYLGRARTELSQLLSKLRSNMQLLSFSTAAAAVSAEDSVALWTAWRETLFAAIEDCGMLALESDLDDGRATTQRRREAVERLETLQRSLATHALSLDEALVQLRNTEAKLRQTAAAATAATATASAPAAAGHARLHFGGLQANEAERWMVSMMGARERSRCGGAGAPWPWECRQ